MTLLQQLMEEQKNQQKFSLPATLVVLLIFGHPPDLIQIECDATAGVPDDVVGCCAHCSKKL